MVNIINSVIQRTLYSVRCGLVTNAADEFHSLTHCVDETGSISTKSGNHPFSLQFDHEVTDTSLCMFAHGRLQSELTYIQLFLLNQQNVCRLNWKFL